MFCQKCGAENKDGAKFCNSCGADLNQPVQPQAPSTACKACGNPLLPGERYCSKCLVIAPNSGGASSSPATSSTKSHGILLWGAIIGGLILVLIIIALVAPTTFGIIGISTGISGQYYQKGSVPPSDDPYAPPNFMPILSIGSDNHAFSEGFGGSGTWKVEGNILQLSFQFPDHRLSNYRIEGNELIPISGDTITWVKWK